MAQFTPEEAQAIVNRYNAALASGKPVTASLAKDMRDAAIGIKDYSDSLHKKVNDLKDATIKTADRLSQGEEGLSVYTDVVEKGADALGAWASKLPFFGGAAKRVAEFTGKYFAAAMKQGDEIFKNYQSMSRSGLVVGMDSTFKNLQAAGFTVSEIGEFTSLMKKNATTLVALGGTAADGLKGFTEVSRSLTTTNLMTQFSNMGMSITDITEGSTNYLKFQQLNGSSKIKTTAELTAGTTKYIFEQDRLAKLTGLNAERQNEAYAKAMRLEQFNANQVELQRKIDAGGTGAKEAEAELNRNRDLMAMMTAAGAESQSDGLAMVLSNAVNDPAYVKFNRAFPNLVKQIQAGEKNSNVLFDSLGKEATTTMENNLGTAQAGEMERLMGPVTGIMALSAIGTKNYVSANAKAIADQEAQKTGAADPNAARMAAIKNAQRNATQSADAVINKGIGPATSALKLISGLAQQTAGVAGQAAGKEGQAGGGTTLWDKARGLFGFGKSSGAGDENARVMPGGSLGSNSSTSGMSRNATTAATTAPMVATTAATTAPMVAATTAAAATAAPIAATTAAAVTAATVAPSAATTSTAASNTTTNTRDMQLSQGQAEIKAGIPAGMTATSSAFARQSTEKPNSNKQNGPVWFVNPFKVISNELSRAGILQSNYTTTTAKTSKEQLANQQSIQSESDKSLEINSAKLNSITELTSRIVSKGINPTQKSFETLSAMLELRSTSGGTADSSSKLTGTNSLLNRSKAMLNNMVGSSGSSSGGSAGSSGGSAGGSPGGSAGGSAGGSPGGRPAGSAGGSPGAAEGTPSGSPAGTAANAMKLNAGGTGSVAGGTAETEKAGGLSEGTGPTTVGQNQQLFLQAMTDLGVTDPKIRASMAAAAEGESGFKMQSEIGYQNTSNENIRKSFGAGSIFGKMPDDELTALKADPVKFFDYVYGDKNPAFKGYGNDQPGDGYKYRGRGFIGITFKTNYKKYGEKLGIDLVGNPDLANDPKIAAKIAVMMMLDGMKRNPNADPYTQVARSIGNSNAVTEQRKKDAYARNLETGQFGSDKVADLSFMNKAATQTASATAPVGTAAAEIPAASVAAAPIEGSEGKKMQSAQLGGVLTGPKDGYQAMLHGDEAVVPLPDGKSIPLDMPNQDDGSAVIIASLLAEKVQKLGLLVDGMTKHANMSKELLQLQG
jgi:predicted chitinase